MSKWIPTTYFIPVGVAFLLTDSDFPMKEIDVLLQQRDKKVTVTAVYLRYFDTFKALAQAPRGVPRVLSYLFAGKKAQAQAQAHKLKLDACIEVVEGMNPEG